ncbi:MULTISPECIES: FtsX-like permease family protein [Alteromonadaceae]|uniref:FtsX-like permease family protein n=1 Tax=Brumicola blandensis TaxID=3075611 RepID=A0AAW8QZ52_9ALTE|nr:MULTISPECIES: FtsX-like permease family protein [unclassified Alteromonas]MDT0582301.1 FtsX-like permease family protein [Alteromonas sp. W409]MDT0628522.1 FtsX-like permease family protein [Alteromonas sp. W364]
MRFRVAKQSLLNRKVSVLLTFFALVVSVCLLISIEHIRNEAKQSFYRTVSGVDLIVGGRTGPINLLLSSVFRVGANANAVSWESYQEIIEKPQVKWSIPLSLGDSHKGFAVIGTTNAYFEHYRFGDKSSLAFANGQRFAGTFDLVLGADVANKLGYQLGDEVIISHGVGSVSFSHHDAHPFKVTGILKPTGTPVDQAIHIGLSAVEAVHQTPQRSLSRSSLKKPASDKVVESQTHEGSEHDQHEHDHDHHEQEHGHHEHEQKQADSPLVHHEHAELALEPSQISAFMLGLQSRIAVLQVQRQVNQYNNEALSAIIPGVALAELWRLVGAVENVLRVISAAVLIASLLGLCTMLLATLRERKQEIAVLRVMGAKPSFVFWLIELEALTIAAFACVSGLALIVSGIWLSRDFMLAEYGMALSVDIFSAHTAVMLGVIMLSTFLIALVPSFSAYKSARLV